MNRFWPATHIVEVSRHILIEVAIRDISCLWTTHEGSSLTVSSLSVDQYRTNSRYFDNGLRAGTVTVLPHGSDVDAGHDREGQYGKPLRRGTEAEHDHDRRFFLYGRVAARHRAVSDRDVERADPDRTGRDTLAA